jgi:hypothetical protein
MRPTPGDLGRKHIQMEKRRCSRASLEKSSLVTSSDNDDFRRRCGRPEQSPKKSPRRPTFRPHHSFSTLLRAEAYSRFF